MAAPVDVLLFFSGLMAFYPVSYGSSWVNAVLLKDDYHEAFLTVPLENLVDKNECKGICSKVKIEKVELLCRCPLEGVEIKFDSELGTKQLPYRPPGDMPSDTNGGDIGWLVSMWFVNLDASHVSEIKAAHEGKEGTSMQFGWAEAATCQFEESYCDGKRWVWKVSFESPRPWDPSQAVAEEVVFKTKVKSAVTLKKGSYTRLELQEKNGEPCPVFVTNAMKKQYWPARVDLCKNCVEDAGGHFGHYGRLASGNVAVVPERICKHVELKVRPPLCEYPQTVPDPQDWAEHPESVGDRIICPSVILQQ